MSDKTCLSYWFPKIEAAGLPAPRTTIVKMSHEALRDVWGSFDGKPLTEASEPFFAELRDAANAMGYPCFLRSGQTSGKYDWARTCYLTDPEKLADHVRAIIYSGELASMIGLPADVWAVREYLPIEPLGICTRWQGMPVCREFRAFVRDGEVECWHPYWPLGALEQGGCADAETVFAALQETPDFGRMMNLAQQAGAAVGGYWSADLLWTQEGWYLTDMAEGEKSFHWPECPQAGDEAS